MFIKYNLPNLDDTDSLRRLSLTVRREIERFLPTDFTFRSSVPEDGYREDAIYVDFRGLPGGVANILSDYLSAIALKIEGQPDKWVEDETELETCPFCGGEGADTISV